MTADRSREFLIARIARDRYEFMEPLFVFGGEGASGGLYAARTLAHRMNRHRDLSRFPELAVKAGQLQAMGLIQEIFCHVIALYEREVSPGLFREAGVELSAEAGEAAEEILLGLSRWFPARAQYAGGLSPREYLDGETGGHPNREVLLEENLLLGLARENPGGATFAELFDDAPLRSQAAYAALPGFFDRFLGGKPPFGPDGQTLLQMLRAPLAASPDSLEGQLEFILRRWAPLVSPYRDRILTSLDILREEERPAFAGFGGAPVAVTEPRLGALVGDEDWEAYSPDSDWMGSLVLMAKSVLVWLHQLSVKHGREITRLDQVPDAELDQMAGWGVTGLWLIGVWERSPASREIKRRTGNPEAEASAYSLFDYDVAASIGGRHGLEDLKRRAGERGIRLAADMVPNHTGIYSRWVVEHPDWFIQASHPPFPSYRFTGPDLSSHPDVGIQIEDGYWQRSDAAVVFKRVDRRSGEERYIYHGNDGTGLPWNDTAQLDYLKAEVREAVAGSIAHVASMFPVIRFDAAMTLARRHFRRLWFPPPGSGGDIPSRSGHGVSAEEFDRLFPREFWREVVDRVAVEAPGTLLLAEAFWLMEGYFVRTLGMHRVYNSAFMNMLKREANAEYRMALKNVLEYDPEILKRYVNFMNNPDEETAVAQFGTGDKYFGTAVMLATLPGLPMIGHGQVEGFTEKYGMEYGRSYVDEQVNEGLVDRHRREVFPLLRRRRVFSEARHFTLYDLVRRDGSVDENVYAYTNRRGGERCLVLYNNVWGEADGWIRESVAVAERSETGIRTVRRTLAAELGIGSGADVFCRFRDSISGLEYIRSGRELHERGLRVELGAFKYHAFTDFQPVGDETGEWRELCRFLDGRGVDDLDGVMRELLLSPLHQACRRALGSGALGDLVRAAGGGGLPDWWAEVVAEFLGRCRDETGEGTGPEAARTLAREAETLLGAGWAPPLPLVDPAVYHVVFPYLVVRRLGEAAGGGSQPERSLALFDELLLSRETERSWRELAAGPEEVARRSLLLRLLVRHGATPLRRAVVEGMTGDPDLQRFLGVNRHRDVVWFVEERFTELVSWLALANALEAALDEELSTEQRETVLKKCAAEAETMLEAAARSAFAVERFVAEIELNNQDDKRG